MIKVCVCKVDFLKARCNSGGEFVKTVPDAFKIGITYEYENGITNYDFVSATVTCMHVYVKEDSTQYLTWSGPGRPHFNFSLSDFRDSFVDLNEYREFKLNQILTKDK